MNVFVVTKNTGAMGEVQTDVLGVCSTQAKAEHFISLISKPYNGSDYNVEEFELDTIGEKA